VIVGDPSGRVRAAPTTPQYRADTYINSIGWPPSKANALLRLQTGARGRPSRKLFPIVWRRDKARSPNRTGAGPVGGTTSTLNSSKSGRQRALPHGMGERAGRRALKSRCRAPHRASATTVLSSTQGLYIIRQTRRTQRSKVGIWRAFLRAGAHENGDIGRYRSAYNTCAAALVFQENHSVRENLSASAFPSLLAAAGDACHKPSAHAPDADGGLITQWPTQR